MNRRDCLILFGVLFATPSVFAFPSETTQIQRQLRFNLSLSNPFNDELVDQNVWLYLPANDTPTQQVTSIVISDKHQILYDELNHTILKIEVKKLLPLSTRLINIVVNLKLNPIPKAVALSDPDLWRVSERFIEVSDPKVQHIANLLKKSTEWETATSIYEWVRQNLIYAGYIADDLGAKYAINEKKGDCTEYAYLSVALARANGIPARMVGGYVTTQNIAPRPEDYHNWAEFYIDGTWHLVDAQKQNWLESSEKYIAFRIYRDASLNPIERAHRFKVDGKLQVKF